MVIGKTFKFEAAHHLPGHKKCGRKHGHTYKVTVEVEGSIQNDTGMVMDLNHLGQLVNSIICNFDHDDLNSIFQIPTCEIMAQAIYDMLRVHLPPGVDLCMVQLQEGEGGYAIAT